MSIIVKKQLITKSPKDLSDSVMIPATNAIVEGLQKEIQEKLKSVKCENCKENTKGIILIKADLKKNFNIEKSGFCCAEFQDSIHINR